MLLALAALAEGREVLVSRGELIEIGDGFRIPDVLARSGARLREVGTTNRTRAADYEAAIGPETALLLRVHQSNFRQVGFTAAAAASTELARGRASARAAARRRPRLGCARRRSRASRRPRASLAAGADLVCFSGDKLLGGPQAGIVAGRADLVERLRRHPLQRALRADKLSLAALEGTLPLYLEAPGRDPGAAHAARAGRVGARARGAARGGGRRRGRGDVARGSAAAPCRSPSCRASPARSRRSSPAALRAGEPPVVAVVRDGRTLLDCRTLTDAEADEVARAVRACRSR